jgi:AcrR family transcriptional regulator
LANEEAGSPRRERRRLAMRSRILESAVARFQEQGYEATTVAQICEGADVAYGTFFNHFPSKLDLLREIVDEGQARMAARLEELAKQPTSMREQLTTFFGEFARNAEEVGPGHRELMAQLITLGYQEAPAEKDRRLHAAFRAFLEPGMARGEIRDADLDALTEILVGAYTSLTLGWVHFDDYPLRARAEAVAKLLAQLLNTP